MRVQKLILISIQKSNNLILTESFYEKMISNSFNKLFFQSKHPQTSHVQSEYSSLYKDLLIHILISFVAFV